MTRKNPSGAIDTQIVVLAVEACERYRWDAAILTAATSLGAGILYSEDFNDGQHYGSVRACNPFTLPLPSR